MKSKSIYTFEEFIQHGVESKNSHLVDGVPWAFDFHGIPATHVNDECYILPSTCSINKKVKGGFYKFTPTSKIIIFKEGLFGLVQKSNCSHHPYDREETDDGTAV